MAQSFEVPYMAYSIGQSGLPPASHSLPWGQQLFSKSDESPQNALPSPLPEQYGQAATHTPTHDLNPSMRNQARAARAAQACTNCRSRKQKCNEARPCEFCRANNFSCQYKDARPTKQDKILTKLQASVDRIVKSAAHLEESVDRIEKRFDRIEEKLDYMKDVPRLVGMLEYSLKLKQAQTEFLRRYTAHTSQA